MGIAAVGDGRLARAPCGERSADQVTRRTDFAGTLPKHAAFGREPEEDLPDGFEMDRAALALLGPGVDVAQAALERVLVKDRGGARGAIDRSNNVARLLDRPGRGEAQLPVPLGRELAVAFGVFPHVLEGRVD